MGNYLRENKTFPMWFQSFYLWKDPPKEFSTIRHCFGVAWNIYQSDDHGLLFICYA